MKTGYQSLAAFPKVKDATPLLKWLDEQQIPYELEQPRKNFDISFAFVGQFNQVSVTIPEAQFEQTIIRLKSEGLLKDSPESYLEGFSEQELRDVVEKADEWEAYNVAEAEKLLADQGIRYSESEKAALRDQRFQHIRRSKDLSPILLLFIFLAASTGWIAAITYFTGPEVVFDFLIPMTGPLALFSIGLGWIFTFLRRKDPAGKDYFVFGSATRKWGLFILLASSGAVLLFVGLVMQLL